MCSRKYQFHSLPRVFFTYVTRSLQFIFSSNFQTIFISVVLFFFLLFGLFSYISLVSLHTLVWYVLVIHSHTLPLAKSCCVGEVTSQFPQVNPVFVGNKYTPQPLVQSYSYSFLKSVINWQPFVQQIQLIQLVYSERY